MSYKTHPLNDYISSDDTSDIILMGGNDGSDHENDELNISNGYPVSKLIEGMQGGNSEKIGRFKNLVIPTGLVIERYLLSPKKSSSKISGGNKKLSIFEDIEYHMEPIENNRFERLFASVKKNIGQK